MISLPLYALAQLSPSFDLKRPMSLGSVSMLQLNSMFSKELPSAQFALAYCWNMTLSLDIFFSVILQEVDQETIICESFQAGLIVVSLLLLLTPSFLSQSFQQLLISSLSSRYYRCLSKGQVIFLKFRKGNVYSSFKAEFTQKPSRCSFELDLWIQVPYSCDRKFRGQNSQTEYRSMRAGRRESRAWGECKGRSSYQAAMKKQDWRSAAALRSECTLGLLIMMQVYRIECLASKRELQQLFDYEKMVKRYGKQWQFTHSLQNDVNYLLYRNPSFQCFQIVKDNAVLTQAILIVQFCVSNQKLLVKVQADEMLWLRISKPLKIQKGDYFRIGETYIKVVKIVKELPIRPNFVVPQSESKNLQFEIIFS